MTSRNEEIGALVLRTVDKAFRDASAGNYDLQDYINDFLFQGTEEELEIALIKEAAKVL
jgi:hypothetical protein